MPRTDKAKTIEPAPAPAPAPIETAPVVPPFTPESAFNALKAAFPSERWAKIEKQARTVCGLDAEGLQSLCKKLMDTRAVRYPDLPEAALYSAANGLLLAINSHPTAEDRNRFLVAIGREPIATAEAAPAARETAA